jgi:hypothetical protein
LIGIGGRLEKVIDESDFVLSPRKNGIVYASEKSYDVVGDVNAMDR